MNKYIKIMGFIALYLLLVGLLLFVLFSPSPPGGRGEWLEDKIERQYQEDVDACLDDYRTDYKDCMLRQHNRRHVRG